MKKMKYKFLPFCLGLSMILGLASCKSNTRNSYDGYASVTYNLEGGIYRGSSEAVKVYYNVSEGSTQNVGKTLDSIDNNNINPYGDYVLKGWYYKDENGNKVSFTSNYKLGHNEQLNVYADWGRKITFTWEFKANVEGKDVVLASYDYAQPGDTLSVDTNRLKTLQNALLENNYTYNGSFEYNSKTYSIDELNQIVMPDSTENHTETIYVDCIDGRYKIINTLAELNAALKSDMIYEDDIYYDGIYVNSDIESTTNINFAQLSGNKDHTIKLIGNNHTISYSCTTSSNGVSGSIDNVSYKFGTIFNQVSYWDIENVNFNVTCTANVRNSAIVGFAMNVNNTTINNVNVNFNYKISGKGSDGLYLPTDTDYNGIYNSDGSTNNNISGLNCTITNITKGE